MCISYYTRFCAINLNIQSQIVKLQNFLSLEKILFNNYMIVSGLIEGMRR